MLKKIVLSNILKQQMFDYAVSSPDQEVCGLLGGQQTQLTKFYPIKNIADDPRREFLMDPEEQITAMKIMRENDEILTGIFHSHPITAAEPSAKDLNLACYPDTIYLILTLLTSPPELRAHYFDGDGFKEITINVVDSV